MNPNNFLLFLILTGSCFLFSCNRNVIPNPADTLSENIRVERTSKGDYKLFCKDKSVWEITYAETINNLDWGNPTIIFEGDFIEFPKQGKKGRLYFGVTSKEKGERYIVTERIVPMKGMNNFRDIGGLPTSDGRIVEWGQVFRSGKLADLTTNDLWYMDQLGITAVFDFRNDLEIKKDKDRLPEGVAYFHTPIIDKEGSEYTRIKKEVTRGKLKGLEAKKYFEFVMEQFADSVAVNFKPVLDAMLGTPKGSVPLLYHCSGGKDRTGIMTMIILAALGVEKDVIKKDYLMSNFYRYKENKEKARKVALVGIDGKTASYAFVVQEEYFDAVFDVIENKYGGIDHYLKVKFDMDEEKRNKLKELYTREIPKVEK